MEHAVVELWAKRVCCTANRASNLYYVSNVLHHHGLMCIFRSFFGINYVANPYLPVLQCEGAKVQPLRFC